MMDPKETLAYFQQKQSEMLEELLDWVKIESPTTNKASVDRFSEVVAQRLAGLGMKLERVPVESRGDHWIARWGSSENKILIVGHTDTVWELGTLNQFPVSVENDIARGPGIFDMKGGILLTCYALQLIKESGYDNRSITFLLNSDEEEGSTTSRELIQREALGAICALILEPAGPNNSLKTKRRGPGRFHVKAIGKAAHAGVEPEKGVNAIEELSHQILEIQSWNRQNKGASIHVGIVRGGTRTNVIPAEAEAIVDVRADSAEDVNWVKAQFAALKARHPAASLNITGDFERSPMERTPQVLSLYQDAFEIGRNFDYHLSEFWTGGASDGNFTAGMGVPTLDGLGPEGAAAHALAEHILISSLPKRANLLYHLLLKRS